MCVYLCALSELASNDRPLAVQVDTSWSQVICCYKNALTNDMREIYGFLRLVSWPPFASPHASSGFANLRWLVSTCVDLQVRLARALCCHSLETKMEANLLFGSFCSVSWSCQCVMLQAMKQSYRREVKKISRELNSALKDPSVTILSSWLKVMFGYINRVEF